MLYLIIYTDNAGTGDLRKELQANHIAFRKGLGDQLKIAGPRFSEDEGPSVGSVIVVEAESMVDARAAVADDPYLVRGVFNIDSVSRINPRTWKPVEI